MASQITSLTIVYSTVYSGADQRKQQSLASLAFVRGIHRWPVNSPPKGPVTQKIFPFDDVIMYRHHFNIATTLSKTLKRTRWLSYWDTFNLNSLAPGKSGGGFQTSIFYLISLTGICRSYDNTLRWMPRDLVNQHSCWARFIYRQ